MRTVGAAKLMMLPGIYRVDVESSSHPLKAFAQDRLVHEWSREIAWEPLTEAEITLPFLTCLYQRSRELDRILFKQTSHESRVQVCSDFGNLAVGESAHPAVPIIKPEPVPRGGKRMQLNHRPVTTH
jgi:hypothetical protein